MFKEPGKTEEMMRKCVCVWMWMQCEKRIRDVCEFDLFFLMI